MSAIDSMGHSTKTLTSKVLDFMTNNSSGEYLVMNNYSSNHLVDVLTEGNGTATTVTLLLKRKINSHSKKIQCNFRPLNHATQVRSILLDHTYYSFSIIACHCYRWPT